MLVDSHSSNSNTPSHSLKDIPSVLSNATSTRIANCVGHDSYPGLAKRGRPPKYDISNRKFISYLRFRLLELP